MRNFPSPSAEKRIGVLPDMERLLSTLKRYCLSITNSSWDAEDLMQETCVRALPVVNGTRLHPNPTAYVLRIAKNLSIDHARRKHSTELVTDQHMQNIFDDMENDYEIEDALRLLVLHLSPLQRNVFLLREVFRYTGAEVAGFLNTSEGAVKAALHRARTTIERLTCDASDKESVNSGDSNFNEILLAYMTAVREANPQAIVLLALVNNGQMDTIQAVSHAKRLSVSAPSATAGTSNTASSRWNLFAAA
ncbi:RNA polymerase sigma factor [Paenibacillus sepulcri]|uniref:RNA polymerase sigma factor n=1 Tax=Paenibacillus sepulcri TaxID=359917 RepID=A0ABS7BXG1_9BACL|nr:RNA polymerase sigma factor [Paenibacillus sepulcri]